MSSSNSDYIDGNTWWWITESRVNFTSALFYNGNGAPYFATNNTAAAGMHWQIYTLPNGNIQIRNQVSYTLKQLGVCYNVNETSSSKTQPCMEEANAAEEQEWTIAPWGDGSYEIKNVVNGTGFNLDWHPGGPGFLSPDTAATPKNPAQHWYLSSIGLVNDGLYSTSIVPSSTSAAASATKTSSKPASASATATGSGSAASATSSSGAPTQQKSSSSGLSSGAAAGIGVGVAVVVIALAAFAFFFLRRRKAKSKQPVQELPSNYGNAAPGQTYEKTGPSGPVHEAPTNTPPFEVYNPPTELPAEQGSRFKR